MICRDGDETIKKYVNHIIGFAEHEYKSTKDYVLINILQNHIAIS